MPSWHKKPAADNHLQADCTRSARSCCSKVPADNGWRIFSHVDSSEYLHDADNLEIVDYNRACEIEPVLLGIWDTPVGSDLQVVDEGDGLRIVDTVTGREVPRDELW